VRVPDGVDLKAAVSLVLDWVTAYQMLHHAAHIKSGQKIFVHGLSGGVGVAAIPALTNSARSQSVVAKADDQARQVCETRRLI
jgi:NADPH:quinone reductase-like Zn-dependent oxidoreductase